MSDDRIFELRTYVPVEGKRDALLARLRDTASVLFEKHGMTNIGYWLQTDDEGQVGDTIVYLVAHESLEARVRSWKAFVADPEWVALKETGEEVTASMESQLLTPTQFSGLR